MFSIIINGEVTRYFSSQRGLKQGDPISPYLFIIMAEALGRIIKHFRNTQVLKGVIPAPNCTTTLHNPFVDETIFIDIAKRDEAI